MKRLRLLALALACTGSTAFSQIQSPAPFKTGDRVAFVGNSITEAGYYESYIWLYYMLHFPRQRIAIFNLGIGGDRAKNMVDRFDDDVLPKHPTVICLTFGMNDTGYSEFLGKNADSAAKARIAESFGYYQEIETKLKALPNVRKVLESSSPYDETVKNPKNYFPGKSDAMLKIIEFQEASARVNHWGYVDYFRPMTEINKKRQAVDSAFTLTGDDRIHPGNAGHFVMAWLFLKAQGLGDSAVADIGIDASRKLVTRSGNCTVSGLDATTGGLRFDYLARSLPYPVDTIARMWGNNRPQSGAVSVMPFYEQFNREMLTVKGLTGNTYTVSMDGQPVGRWSAGELGAGINLARVTQTPEYQQAMSILLLNEERMGLEGKLRAYYWLQFDYLRDIGLLFKDNEAALDSVINASAKRWDVASKRDNYRAARYPTIRATWQKQMDVITDEIYAINQPVKHLIEIKEAK
jgi:lysophospholipase L1-like esterase